MRRWFVAGASILLSGFLFAAAMPPGDVQVLGWICFVPLLSAIQGVRFAVAALAPVATFLFAAWLTTTGWLYSWPRLEGEAAWHYVGFLLYSLALLPVFVAWSLQKTLCATKVLVLAAGFVAAESLLLLYLPAHLALTQYRSPFLLALAPWVGIWGVSGLLWFAQLGLSLRIRRRIEKAPAPSNREWIVGSIVFVLLCVEHPEPDKPGSQKRKNLAWSVRVAAVQSTEPDLFDQGVAAIMRTGHPRLLVWPELSAIGVASGGRTERLRELSRSLESVAFITTFPDDARPLPQNAAAMFLAGTESERYFKRRPFGAETGGHRAGRRPVAVGEGDLRVGLNICFDSCFPYLIRETACLDEVGVIALPCMGPESPYGVIQAIHGAFTPFRSAEYGIPIVRSESSAFAMVTDASGQIVAQAPPGFQGVLMTEIQTLSHWTFLRWAGDWVMYLSWAIVIFASGRAVVQVRARRSSL